MEFRTQIPISKSSNPIDYNSKMISLGSCFAVNMAEKFDYFKFQNTINPFGIIFNPVSIEKIIQRVAKQELFTEKDIFFHNDLWNCYEIHSELSHPDKEEFLNTLNQILNSTIEQLTDSTHILITYGTSWIYRNIESRQIVANCHKVPQKQFTKELLSVEEIQKSIENTIGLIHSINPNAKFIFTVSPVRHIKDGFVENQLSKSHLFTGIHHILKEYNYFPSYEIMMDELRDYRFYAEDMLHPNQVAVDYIWQLFRESYIEESIFKTMNLIENIQKSLKHKPFNPNSENHQKFKTQLAEKITNLVAEYSFMKF